MRARRWIAVVALGLATPACAAILGDDFVVDESEGEGGSGNHGSGCSDNGDCGACSQCACASEIAACNASADCVGLVNCVAGCAVGDQTCLDDCTTAWPGGVELAGAFGNCGCTKCGVSCQC